MRNDPIRDSIAKLTSNPRDEMRIELYRQLGQGSLFVVVADIPAGMGSGDLLLDRNTDISMLTTCFPNGGDAIVAFTDLESLEARETVVARVKVSMASAFKPS
jgi:hypothetical protein